MRTLYFVYNEKEFYIDIDKNKTIKQKIKEISSKYGINKKASIYFEEGTQFIRLDDKEILKIIQILKIKQN